MGHLLNILSKGNFKEIPFFDNKFLPGGIQPPTREDLSDINWNRYKQNLIDLNFSSILNNDGSFLSFQTFQLRTNINIDFVEYLRITEKIEPARTLLVTGINLETRKINRILQKKKIKAKSLRQFMFHSKFELKHCVPSKTRYSRMNTPFDRGREERFFITWTTTILPMNVRSFIFNFVNNMLKLNSNLARMLREPDRAFCTFCTLCNYVDPPSEKPPHLFALCPLVKPTVESHMNSFLKTPNTWTPEWQILGAPDNYNIDFALIINIEIHTVNLYTFNCRRQKILPNNPDLKYHMNYYREIYKFTKRYRIALEAWEGRAIQ